MKKVLGALLLVIAVAFTSTVSASTNDNIPIGVEYVVSVNSVDFVAVATDVPTVPTGIVVINVADKSVNYVASVEGLIKVFSLSRGNSTNGTEFVKIFLPVEVGLSNSNILNT